MFENLDQIRMPIERREAIVATLDEGYLLSDIITLPPAIQGEVLEVVNGYHRDGGTPRQEPHLRRQERFKLRTVDGEPLGPVKIGLRPFATTRDQARAEMQGISADITRTHGAEIEVDAEAALPILRQYGYGLVTPRHRNRHGVLRGENDSIGRPVKPRDMWRVVEVGSRFEELARKNGELKEVPRGRNRKG